MSWSFDILRAGAFRLDGGSMFGVVPKPIWSRLIEPDERNRIPLQTNCVLLRRAEADSDIARAQLVLIEVGYGEKWSDKKRDIFALEDRTVVDALDEIHLKPADITHVIVSHLHFDHAGALTSLNEKQEPVPTFPNARIIVQQREWEDALANRSTMTKTYLRNHLDPVRDQVRLVDGEAEVLPGVHVSSAPGHTWGQQAIRFWGVPHDAAPDTPERTYCFPGDVMPTVNHAGLAFSMGYDMEPYTNMKTKRALLERASNEGWRLILDHEPGDPVVRVERHGEHPDRFVLAPVPA